MFETVQNSDRVEIWSSRRIPFEPKGEMLDLRTELRAAVRGLKATPRDTLQATYQSTVEGACDVENVLFYNLGTSAFANSVAKSVQFRRLRITPPESPTGRQYAHYSRYEMTPDGPVLSNGRPACAFRSAPLPRTGPFQSILPVWRAVAEGDLEVLEPVSPAARIAMDVTVHSASKSFDPVRIAKPLIDGIIVALHAHDGTALDVVSSRVATKLGVSDAVAANMLMQGTTPVLGTRRLLWPYGTFVQWNPADDRVDDGIIRILPSSDGVIRASGVIFAVD